MKGERGRKTKIDEGERGGRSHWFQFPSLGGPREEGGGRGVDGGTKGAEGRG